MAVLMILSSNIVYHRTAMNAPFMSRQTEDRYGREASRLTS